MAVTLNIKMDDDVVKSQRQATAKRVLDYFGSRLPTSRLLCFLDDTDAPGLKLGYGVANRGGYIFRHVSRCSDERSLPWLRASLAEFTLSASTTAYRAIHASPSTKNSDPATRQLWEFPRGHASATLETVSAHRSSWPLASGQSEIAQGNGPAT